MFDKRLFQLLGIQGRVVILAALIVIQAVMIIGQARALAIAVVNLWQLRALSTIVMPTLIFGGCFLIRHLLTVIQNRVFFRSLSKPAASFESN